MTDIVPMLYTFYPMLFAFGISLFLTAAAIQWAPQVGLVDQPNARKVHARPIPKAGGVAIVGAVTLISGGASRSSGTDIALSGFGVIIALLGLWDDLIDLSWKVRLGIQTLIAACAAWWIGVESIPGGILAVFWIVALVNAFNMLDNMDALSAGIAWIAAGTFAVLPGDYSTIPYLVLMGALAGFLCFNRPPARIFMGDTGSTFLGFFLGTRSLADGFLIPDAPQTWLVPLCVLAVPLYDQVTVVALRLWQGKSPFHADKQHLSHRLVALGLSQPAAVGVILLFGVVSGAAGIAIARLEEAMAWVVFGGLVFGWLVVALVEYAPHLQKRNPGEPGSHAPGCERSHLRG